MTDPRFQRRTCRRREFYAASRPTRHGLSAGLVVACVSLSSACSSTDVDADYVLRGAVYTMDSTRPRAEAIAIRGDRIVYVGDTAGVRDHTGRDTRVIDGAMILPGFHDTHVHPVTGGIELGECDLNPAESLDDVKRIVRECAARDAGSEWVRGGGWALTIFPDANPSRRLLDSLVPNRPAYLSAADGHSAWVNTRALEIAGITRTTKDPEHGRIERDDSGEATGTLREDAADLVSARLPAYDGDDYYAGLERGLAMARSFGVTTLHEASASERVAAAYARADSAGTLTARAILSLRVDPAATVDSEVRRLTALRERTARGLVRPIATKIFLDGVLEAHTAAVLAPYVDRPGYTGSLNFPPDKFNALVRSLDSAGFKVHVHAIGDRAIRTALDGFAAQHARDGGSGPKHIIAHIQLFDPADIPRFARLGVVATFQPLWAYADEYITKLTEPKLGPSRSRWLYPIASVLKTGAIVAAGSDWSVSSMNPLDAIQVAVTRRGLRDSTGGAWIADERISLEDALRAYTINGAVASEQDSLVGTLAVGKLADVIVLSRDLFTIPPHSIAKTEVRYTFLAGKAVYEASSP